MAESMIECHLAVMSPQTTTATNQASVMHAVIHAWYMSGLTSRSAYIVIADFGPRGLRYIGFSQYIYWNWNFNFRYVRFLDLHIPREKWPNYLQTEETLIRSHVLWHLIWVCTVCQLPFYRSPYYNVLKCTWTSKIFLTGQIDCCFTR